MAEATTDLVQPAESAAGKQGVQVTPRAVARIRSAMAKEGISPSEGGLRLGILGCPVVQLALVELPAIPFLGKLAKLALRGIETFPVAGCEVPAGISVVQVGVDAIDEAVNLTGRVMLRSELCKR